MRKLSLGPKIYLSLAAILLPVFALTIFVQTQVTRPVLEEEVRQVGLSVCRALSTDVAAFRLLTRPEALERRIIEVTWQQPSVMRLDVITRDENGARVLASNIAEETPFDLTGVEFGDSPRTELKRESGRGFWEVIHPIKEGRRAVAWVRAEVSLELVTQVVAIFSKIAFMGALLAIGLLIAILSYYLKRTIENERRLRDAESENVALTQRLFRSEKLAVMGQLTASFAHEIGTPLSSLSGHLQLLGGEVRGEGGEGRLSIINSQVSRIEGIVKDFLASTHAPPQQRQLVDVGDLIRRIHKLVTPRVAGIGANVAIEVQEGLEPLRVVPTDLEQVLLNLTNNAIDALERSAPPRDLSFHALSSDGLLELTVRDSGEGIPPETIRHVLKPFFTTKAPGQGTGLGLTISQRLIKKYGGRLEVDSTLGKGTTIKVHIPYDSA